MCLLAVLLCIAADASAQTTTYTDRASFEAALQPGYYTQTFDSIGPVGEVPSPQSFTGGASNQFSYNIATADASSLFYTTNPTDVTMTDTWLGAFQADTPLVFNISTPNVTAIGAYFFLTSIVNTFPVEGTLTVTLNNGAFATAGPVTTNTTFIGFTTDTPITSLVFNFTSTVPTTAYATLNDVIVGTAAAVPEPSSMALTAGGLLVGGAFWRLRKRRG